MSFWYLTQCSCLLYYQHVGGTHCLFLRASVLKMEEGVSSVTLGTKLHGITPHYIVMLTVTTVSF